MSGSSYAFQLTALLSPTAGLVKPGMCIVLDPGQERFFVATLAQRTALGRKADGVARTTGNGVNATVEWQTEGYLPAEISGLGPGISSYVRVGDTALLERVVSPLTTDQVVGTCETNGDVHLSVGGAGVPGSSGPFGGAVSAPWAYDTGTTNANPGSGKLRFDASSPPGATHMYISSTDLNGFFWLGFFAIVGGRSGSVIATLRIVRGANPNAFNLYEVTSITPHSGYYEFALSWVAGGTGYVSGETLWFLCDLVGDTGATGPAGPAPTGTGFAHVTGGVLDPAARAVDLSSSDVTGVLPLANEAAPTGTGVVRVSSGAWVTSGSKGTGLQLLRTTSGVTDVEWWTLSVDLASQVTGTLPIGSIGHGTNGQYLQTTSGVPTWTSPGSSNTVAVSNGTAVTWATIVDANVSGSAAIATSKLALPGSASEVFYRSGTAMGAAGLVSIASGGQLQVGASAWATTGAARYTAGSDTYVRNTFGTANTSDLCVWSTGALTAGDTLFLGSDPSRTTGKTMAQIAIVATTEVEWGASATPASPTIDDPYYTQYAGNGATYAQGKYAWRTVTGTLGLVWGGGGRGTHAFGDTPTQPTSGQAGYALLWSAGSGLRHATSGGIVNQLSHGEQRYTLPNASTYGSVAPSNMCQAAWDFTGGVLIQPCVITVPVPSVGDGTDAYFRLIRNSCTDPRALIQLTTGTGGTGTVTMQPGSTALVFIDQTYGVTVFSGTGGVTGSTGGIAGAGGSDMQAQYNNAGTLAGMANVLYVGGKLQLQTAAGLEWKNGASLGDVSWTPTAARTLTLPDATDTLIGKATTDTLTNKTFDTAGTGNSLKINSTAVTDIMGSGKVVLDTSPTITTPAITTSATITRSGIGITAADGLVIQNSTAAALGAQQWSPSIRWIGQQWNTTGAVSDTIEWTAEIQTNQGSDDSNSNLVFSRRDAGGGKTAVLTLKNNAASVTVNGSFTATSNSFVTRSTLGTTSTDGFVANNVTAATSGAPVQYSPRIRLTGAAWNSTGAVSETDDWAIENRPATIAGTTASTLVFMSQIAAAGYGDRVTVSSDGGLTATGQVTASGGSGIGLQASNGAVAAIRGALGAGSTDGISSRNQTAATSGTPVQIGPRFRCSGNVWDTTATASKTVEWIQETLPISGAAPSSDYVFSNELASGGFVERLRIKGDGSIVGTGPLSGVTADTGILTSGTLPVARGGFAPPTGTGPVTVTSGVVDGAAGGTTGTGNYVRDTSPTITTPAIATSATLTNSALATTSTDGLVLQNTTAATAGATIQQSPRIRLDGAAWRTSTLASSVSSFVIENVPIQGSVTTHGSLTVKYSTGGGAYSTILQIQDNGNLVGNGSGVLSGVVCDAGIVTTGGTGTGTLVRATAPTISSPTFSGTPVVSATTEISWTGDAKGTRRQRALAHAQSTSATQVTIDTITVPTNTAQLLRISITGVKSDLSQSYGYTIDITAHNSAGTVTWGNGTGTQLMSAAVKSGTLTNSGQVAISGTTLLIQSGGSAATTIQWTSSVEIIEVIP